MASIAERAHELLRSSAHGGFVTPAAATATDALTVHLAGIETITGVKTFSASPVVPANTFPESAVTNLTTDLAAKATDSLVTHLAGTETVTGAKTFNSQITSAAGVAMLVANNGIIRWLNAAAAVQNLLQLTSGDIFKIGSTGFTSPVTIDAGGVSTITLRTNNVDRLTVSSQITVGEGIAFVLGTTTGSKIGSAANQKIGFYGATAIVQPASTPAAAATQSGSYVQADVQSIATLVNDLRTKLLALGLVA